MTGRAVVSAFIVMIAGSVLHFLWEWTGRSPVAAVFAATNESTWEHLKLAFWPALVLTVPQRMIYGPYPGWLPAVAIRCILPPVLIVLLFYSYTFLAGGHHLAADLAVFAIAVLAGETAGHALLGRSFGLRVRLTALALVLVCVVLFSTLTFSPPDCFLFQDPLAVGAVTAY
jgi:hypothetical protein